jgi:hypothetical protein
MLKNKMISYIDHDQRCQATSHLANLQWVLFENEYHLAFRKALLKLKYPAEILRKEDLFSDPNAGLNVLINYSLVQSDNSDLKWLIKTLKEYIASKKDYGHLNYRPFAPAQGEFHQSNGVKNKIRGQD